MVIKKLLRKLKQTPMDLKTLGSLLPPYAKTATYDQISGKHRSEVFGKYKCIVVLIPSKFSKIGHFVVLLRKPKAIEYFSSLSGSPYSELSRLGQTDKDAFIKLLGSNFIYNSKPLQSKSSTIHDCALWVLARIKLHELKLADFQKIFSRSLHLSNADDIVALMTILLVSEL
jgi:hypothetical protein